MGRMYMHQQQAQVREIIIAAPHNTEHRMMSDNKSDSKSCTIPLLGNLKLESILAQGSV